MIIKEEAVEVEEKVGVKRKVIDRKESEKQEVEKRKRLEKGTATTTFPSKKEVCADCKRKCLTIHGRRRSSKTSSTSQLSAPRSFFKVMLGEFSAELRIPPTFARTIGYLVERYVYLEDSFGLRWRVRICQINGTLAFGNGWKNFTVDHAIKVGEFIVFRHISKCVFSVQIFGTSASERQHLCSKKTRIRKRKFSDTRAQDCRSSTKLIPSSDIAHAGISENNLHSGFSRSAIPKENLVIMSYSRRNKNIALYRNPEAESTSGLMGVVPTVNGTANAKLQETVEAGTHLMPNSLFPYRENANHPVFDNSVKHDAVLRGDKSNMKSHPNCSETGKHLKEVSLTVQQPVENVGVIDEKFSDFSELQELRMIQSFNDFSVEEKSGSNLEQMSRCSQYPMSGLDVLCVGERREAMLPHEPDKIQESRSVYILNSTNNISERSMQLNSSIQEPMYSKISGDAAPKSNNVDVSATDEFLVKRNMILFPCSDFVSLPAAELSSSTNCRTQNIPKRREKLLTSRELDHRAKFVYPSLVLAIEARNTKLPKKVKRKSTRNACTGAEIGASEAVQNSVSHSPGTDVNHYNTINNTSNSISIRAMEDAEKVVTHLEDKRKGTEALSNNHSQIASTDSTEGYIQSSSQGISDKKLPGILPELHLVTNISEEILRHSNNLDSIVDAEHGNSLRTISTNCEKITATTTDQSWLELPSALQFGRARRKPARKVVLLEDSSSRLWPVLYHTSARFSGFISGWGDVARANGIQYGDVCEFEPCADSEGVLKMKILKP